MYAEAAAFYDVILDARGRDAAAEADLVIGEIKRRHARPGALLDVACGTGAHLAHFEELGLDVAGIDLSDDMLRVAAARCPNVPLARGDMRSFDLGRRFDAIVCLFSAIGYLMTDSDLRAAVARMAAHLNRHGVLMIEGWVESEYWLGTTVHAECGDGPDVAVARASRSERVGQRCDIWMRYVAAAPGGLTTIDEHHIMRISDPNEFAAAYNDAGLTFERLPHMLHPGRAVYVGTLGQAR